VVSGGDLMAPPARQGMQEGTRAPAIAAPTMRGDGSGECGHRTGIGGLACRLGKRGPNQPENPMAVSASIIFGNHSASRGRGCAAGGHWRAATAMDLPRSQRECLPSRPRQQTGMKAEVRAADPPAPSSRRHVGTQDWITTRSSRWITFSP
jgi:hypothetical protein